MKYTNTVFHQIMSHIPRGRFQKVVDRHKGDHRVKSLTCWTQLVALIYGQLTHRQSLRDLEQAFNSQHATHYHLGVNQIRRTTLADANAKRAVQIYEEVFFDLLSQVRKGMGKMSGEMVRLIDSTTIDLNKHHYQWARFRSTKAGIKIHTVFDPEAEAPTFFSVTEAKVNDRKAVQTLPLLPGATYVFDRAYNDYGWYYQLHQQDIRFVGRMKSNAQFDVIEQRESLNDNVLEDQAIQLTSQKGANCPVPLRRIRFKRVEDGKELVFISNDLHSSAEEIADLYKQRWQIELFFKWIKQNLKIKRFLGTSENAVRIQVLVALISYLLLRLTQLQNKADQSLQRLARWVNVNIMMRRSLYDAFHPTPPRPCPKTKNKAQLQMALS